MTILKLAVGPLATNCYIVVSARNNAFIIDPGDDVKRIKDSLSQHHLQGRFIVNTHGHIDHVRADAELGLPVYIHPDDARWVSRTEANPMTDFFGSFEPVEPARLLNDGDVIELDDLKMQVLHTPGHTLGSICLAGQGVLFSGDTLFKDGVGRTDFPGSDQEKMQESLKKLSLLDKDTVVYPGHGPQTTIGREFSEK